MKSNSLWRQEEGPTVFAPFDQDTNYFGDSRQNFMLNFRVNNLEELLIHFKDSGIKIDQKKD